MSTQKFWTWFQQNEKGYHELNNVEPNEFLEKIKEFKKQFNKMDTRIPYEIIIPGNLKKLFFQPIRFYKTTRKVDLTFYTNQYVFGEDSSELNDYLIRLLSFYLGEVFLFKKVKKLKLLKYKRNREKIYPAIYLKEFLKFPTPHNLPRKGYKRVPKSNLNLKP